jgi:hypothetical protein
MILRLVKGVFIHDALCSACSYVGVFLVRCRCLWLPCCILFWVSCYDVLTRDLLIIFEVLLCCVHFNVSAINYERVSVLFYIIFYSCSAIIKFLTWLSFFTRSYYVFVMGFFPRSVIIICFMLCFYIKLIILLLLSADISSILVTHSSKYLINTRATGCITQQLYKFSSYLAGDTIHLRSVTRNSDHYTEAVYFLLHNIYKFSSYLTGDTIHLRSVTRNSDH